MQMWKAEGVLHAGRSIGKRDHNKINGIIIILTRDCMSRADRLTN